MSSGSNFKGNTINIPSISYNVTTEVNIFGFLSEVCCISVFSKLTVSSNSVIFLSVLLRITIFGLSSVVKMSAGIVPPFILCHGMSMYMVMCSSFILFSYVARYLGWSRGAK